MTEGVWRTARSGGRPRANPGDDELDQLRGRQRVEINVGWIDKFVCNDHRAKIPRREGGQVLPQHIFSLCVYRERIKYGWCLSRLESYRLLRRSGLIKDRLGNGRLDNHGWRGQRSFKRALEIYGPYSACPVFESSQRWLRCFALRPQNTAGILCHEFEPPLPHAVFALATTGLGGIDAAIRQPQRES